MSIKSSAWIKNVTVGSFAISVMIPALGEALNVLNVESDMTLTESATYDEVCVSKNAVLNLNGYRLRTGKVSGEGVVMSAVVDSEFSGMFVETSDSNAGYVDTGYVPSCTDTIRTKFRLNSLTENMALFSSRKVYNNKTMSCVFTKQNNKLKLRFDRKKSYKFYTIKLTANEDYEIVADFGKNEYVVNGETYKGDSTSEMTGDFLAFTNIYLFAAGTYNEINGNGTYTLDTNAKSCRMYYFSVYDKNGNIKVNMIPAKQDGKVGFFDTVRGSFHPMTNDNLHSYERVAYVTTPAIAEANVYINTGYVPYLTDCMETKVRFDSTGEFQGIFSSRATASTNTFTCVLTRDSTLRFDHHTTNPYVYYNGAGKNVVFSKDKDYEIIMNGNTLEASVNGVPSETPMTENPENSSATTDMTLRLFAVATKGQGHSYFAKGCRMYYFRIKDKDGNIKLDFVPVRRASDGVVGFYDRISGRFVTEGVTEGVSPDKLTAGPVLPTDLTVSGGRCKSSPIGDYSTSSANLFNNNVIYRTDSYSRICFIKADMGEPLRVDYDIGEGNAKVVNMYRLWGGGDGRSPSKWKLYGSNADTAFDSKEDDDSENSGWELLDEDESGGNLPGVASGNNANCCTRIFANDRPFRFYRFKVVEGGNNFLDLTQLEFFHIENTDISGTLHVSVADGEVVLNDTVTFAGDMKVVKEGKGAFQSNMAGQFYLGGTDINAGEFILGVPLSTKYTIAKGAVIGFDISSHQTGPLMVADEDSSISEPFNYFVNCSDGANISKNGFALTSGYDFRGKATVFSNRTPSVRVKPRIEGDGNIFLFGPKGLIITFY